MGVGKTLKQEIYSALRAESVRNLVSLHNDFCVDIKGRAEIYEMDTFDFMFADKAPLEVARGLAEGFDPDHLFFRIDNEGRAASFNTAGDEKSGIDVICLTDWIVDVEHCYIYSISINGGYRG